MKTTQTTPVRSSRTAQRRSGPRLRKLGYDRHKALQRAGRPQHSAESDVDGWLGAHGIPNEDIDKVDMLAYVDEWEDAHPEMIESSRARVRFHREIEVAWREAFEASRVSFASN